MFSRHATATAAGFAESPARATGFAYDHQMPPRSRPQRRDHAPHPLALTADDEEALRRAQLELLAEFDRVCTAHHLEYFALYGTLLGAVRHGGFIPWDDDLDVGMLRADFDRLTEVVADEVDDRFFFQTVCTDPHYGYLFNKLRLKDTLCVDRTSYFSLQHGGIFIDIFPLDAKATGAFAGFEQKLMRYVCFRLLYIKAGYLFMRGTSVLTRITRFAAWKITGLLPRRLIIALAERRTRLVGNDPPEQYVSMYGAYRYDADTIDAAWINPLVELPFENVTIPAFADSDAYLRRVYGNYRQPPPPEQQVGRHEIVELDFGGVPR